MDGSALFFGQRELSITFFLEKAERTYFFSSHVLLVIVGCFFFGKKAFTDIFKIIL